MTSALSSGGTDLRPGPTTDLASIVSTESHDVTALKSRAGALSDDVQRLTAGVDDRGVDRLTAQVRALESPAGRTPVRGPGVSVTLSDAPSSVRSSTTQNINLLLVHQQDIQAVVNAMWVGGATAVVLQGQRLITTTGIKCSGNVVRLHGIPYASPYVIRAVGDQTRLYDALMDSHYLQVYRQQADDPDIAVGWDLSLTPDVRAPAYDGTLDLSYAKVATAATDG